MLHLVNVNKIDQRCQPCLILSKRYILGFIELNTIADIMKDVTERQILQTKQ